MRERILALNGQYRDQLSNDLGVVAGLLYDVGPSVTLPPPRSDDAADLAAWQQDLALVRAAAGKADKIKSGIRLYSPSVDAQSRYS